MTATQAAKADTTPGPFYADAEAAEAFGRRLLVAYGLTEQDAATVARCLVRADLRGVDTHGLQTLPHYLERVRRGLINPRPNLKVERVTPMVARSMARTPSASWSRPKPWKRPLRWPASSVSASSRGS